MLAYRPTDRQKTLSVEITGGCHGGGPGASFFLLLCTSENHRDAAAPLTVGVFTRKSNVKDELLSFDPPCATSVDAGDESGNEGA
jgi:hypothetical protein